MCLLYFYQQLKCYLGNLEEDFIHGGIPSVHVSLYPPSTRTCVTQCLEDPGVHMRSMTEWLVGTR